MDKLGKMFIEQEPIIIQYYGKGYPKVDLLMALNYKYGWNC